MYIVAFVMPGVESRRNQVFKFCFGVTVCQSIHGDFNTSTYIITFGLNYIHGINDICITSNM